MLSYLTQEKIAQLLLIAAVKGAFILLIAWGWLVLFRRVSASIRHWVCTLALLSILVIPVATLVIPAWSMPILPGLFQPEAEGARINWLSKVFAPASFLNDNKPRSNSIEVPADIPSDKINAAKRQFNGMAKPIDLKDPAANASIAAPITISWPSAVLLVWFSGTVLIMGRWLIQAKLIQQITRRGRLIDDIEWTNLRDDLIRRLKVKRPVALVLSDNVSVPLTWGTRRPVVVLPAAALAWSIERRRIILAHELAHIARWDYLMQWVALISCATNWFNPIAWKFAQCATVAREHACDDQVLALGTKSSDYATSLLDIAHAAKRSLSTSGIVLAMAQGSDLARRIRRILDVHQSRHPLTLCRGLSVLLLVAVVLLPLSTVQFSRASAQNPSAIISVALPAWMKNNISKSVFADFENAHPGVSVQMVEAIEVPDPVDGLENYFTATQKYVTTADVLFTQTYDQNLAVVPHGTRAGYFLDLAPLVSGDKSLNLDDFYPQVWKSFQWDKGIWALPFASDLALLAYDPAQFDKAGIAYPNNKWTLNDFVDAVTKLSTKDANNRVTAPGFTNTGRIFRLALWQSLLSVPLFDENILPSQPQFAKPAVESVVDSYFKLQEQGFISGDAPTVPMFVIDIRHAGFRNYRAALLPGGRAGLMTSAFAVSAGTQQPELSYELAKYLTTRAEVNIIGVPARKSLAASLVNETRFPPELKPLAEEGLTNGLTFADMRFTSYLNAAYNNAATAHEGILAVEERAINDLKAADAKKGKLTLAVKEPEVPVLPPGKIALKFDLNSYFSPLPNKEQWDNFIKDFTSSDTQVGLVDLRVTYESTSDAVSKSDCFYYPTNVAPTLTGNSILPLDPFLNADASFDKADFVGSALASVQLENKTYALPIDIRPIILRYDPARLNTAHIPEPANNWTVEAFVEALKALKTTAPDPSAAPFVDNNTNGTYLLVLIAAYGGVPIDYRTDPPTINFANPATVTAIRQVLDLARNGHIAYSAMGDLSGGLSVGPGPMTAIYPNTLDGPGIKKPTARSLPDKPVLFPGGREYTGLAYNLGTAYISGSSQNPEACYRFVSAMSKHPELFTAMPVRRSVLTNATFRSAVDRDLLALYSQIDVLLKDPRTIPFPAFDKGAITISNFLVPHWLYEAFDKYVLNQGDLDAALKDAETYAKAYLGCTANLPPLTMASAGPDTRDTTNAYLDCAVKADGRLKSMLSPMYVR